MHTEHLVYTSVPRFPAMFPEIIRKEPRLQSFDRLVLGLQLHMAISGTFFKPCDSRVVSRCSRTCAIHGGYHENLASHVQPNPDAVQSLRYDRETHSHSRHHEPDPDLVLFAHR